MEVTPICNHCDKGMVMTMAFSGMEWWCWSCGKTDTFFNGLEKRELTDNEKIELLAKKEEAISYLGSQGVLYGGGHREVNGKIIGFRDMSEEMKTQIQKDADSWEYVNSR